MNLNLTRLEKRFDLQTYIEQYDGRMVGENFVMHCPQCEKDEKLYVLMHDKQHHNGDTVPRGTWICYYCNDNDEGGGAGRTCLSLIEWLEDVEFVDAAKRLAEGGTSADADFIGAIEKTLAELDQGEKEDADEAPPPKVLLPREFIRIDERKYPSYVAERGISLERAMRFRLGYCKSGYYENRLIAPVYFDRNLVGFQARYMKKKPPMCSLHDLPCKECGGVEKHKRIKKTKHAAGAKMSSVLYNWDEAREAKRLVLVESPWAVIKLGRCGAGTFGKNLSSAQLELVMKSDASEVVIIWDRDIDHAPGKGGYDKSVVLAERLSQFVRVRAVKLPPKVDIDDLAVREVGEQIERTKAMDVNAAWAEKLKRRVGWIED